MAAVQSTGSTRALILASWRAEQRRDHRTPTNAASRAGELLDAAKGNVTDARALWRRVGEYLDLVSQEERSD